jgi:NAD(P)-dependent dehydrogenase (short-subunit alcohol dehydrogenase family)
MPINPVVLITGCSTGFGRLLVEDLAGAGYTVFATMRDTAGRNRAVADQLSDVSPNLRVLELDVTDEASVGAAVESALASAGHIDVVVNNAGTASAGVMEGYTAEQFQRIFDTNLFGVVRVNRAVLPGMRRRGRGLLIHVTSLAGRVAAAYLGPYCATKWALEALAEVFRLELAPVGVDSVVVEPGKFPTEIFGKMYTPDDVERVAEYGAGDVSRRFFENFHADMVARAQEPVDVVRAIRRLIETPAGQRPFRTLVGSDAAALETYNQAADDIRTKGIQSLNVPELLELKQRLTATEA